MNLVENGNNDDEAITIREIFDEVRHKLLKHDLKRVQYSLITLVNLLGL